MAALIHETLRRLAAENPRLYQSALARGDRQRAALAELQRIARETYAQRAVTGQEGGRNG